MPRVGVPGPTAAHPLCHLPHVGTAACSRDTARCPQQQEGRWAGAHHDSEGFAKAASGVGTCLIG